VLVGESSPDQARREIGRWLLQVAVVLAGTGVLSIVLRQSELSRLPSEEAMQDKERFPELYNLRVHYGRTEFRRSYKRATVEMQRLAGIPVTDKPGEEESEEQF
jgi:hypothetical protein